MITPRIPLRARFASCYQLTTALLPCIFIIGLLWMMVLVVPRPPHSQTTGGVKQSILDMAHNITGQPQPQPQPLHKRQLVVPMVSEIPTSVLVSEPCTMTSSGHGEMSIMPVATRVPPAPLVPHPVVVPRHEGEDHGVASGTAPGSAVPSKMAPSLIGSLPTVSGRPRPHNPFGFVPYEPHASGSVHCTMRICRVAKEKSDQRDKKFRLISWSLVNSSAAGPSAKISGGLLVAGVAAVGGLLAL